MPLDLGLPRNEAILTAQVTLAGTNTPAPNVSVTWTTDHGQFVALDEFGLPDYLPTVTTITAADGSTGAVLSVDDRHAVACTVTAACGGGADEQFLHFIPDVFPTGDVTQANAPFGVAVGSGRTLPVVFTNSTLPNPWPWPAANPVYHINRPPIPGVRLKVGVGPMDGIRDLAYGSVGVTDVVTDANGQVKLTYTPTAVLPGGAQESAEAVIWLEDRPRRNRTKRVFLAWTLAKIMGRNTPPCAASGAVSGELGRNRTPQTTPRNSAPPKGGAGPWPGHR